MTDVKAVCCPALQGDAVVMVEHRSGSSDAYGQGKKAPMALRDFIARMQKGDSNLYMSTQEVRSWRHKCVWGALGGVLCANGRWLSCVFRVGGRTDGTPGLGVECQLKGERSMFLSTQESRSCMPKCVEGVGSWVVLCAAGPWLPYVRG